MKNKIELSKLNNFIKVNLPQDAIIERKQYTPNITLDETDERTYIAKISTPTVDRDGDILMSDGCDISEYILNGVILWNHSYSDLPIGKTLEIAKDSSGITAKIKLAEHKFAQDVWDLIKGGFLRCNSIGFVIKKALIKGTKEFKSYIEEKGLQAYENINDCTRIITEFTLLENSIVPLPANKDAIIYAISKNYEPKLMKDMDIPVEEKVAEQVEPIVEPVKVETPVEPIIEAKVEPIVEPVKVEPIVEPVKVEPVVETIIKPIESLWTIVRDGGYKVSTEDIKLAKAILKGKII